MLPALVAASSGLGLGLALVVAIGAQNASVLRQGLRGEHVLPVVAVCALSDLVLTAAGVAGTGALLDRVPEAVSAVRWAGAGLLVAYGALAARRALRPAEALVAEAAVGSLLWFSALGAGARLPRPVLARPAAWRVLDAGIAGVMVALAVALVRGTDRRLARVPRP